MRRAGHARIWQMRNMARQPYRPGHATLAERLGLITPPNVLLKDDFRRGLGLRRKVPRGLRRWPGQEDFP
jgi:hypothetical protein